MAIYEDMPDGGRAYGSPGIGGDRRGVSHGREGHYHNGHFIPDPEDPPKWQDDAKSVEAEPALDIFAGVDQQFLDRLGEEYEREKAQHLTPGQVGTSLAGGIAIGTIAATLDPNDPAGSLAKGGRNILCVFGIIALYVMAGLLLLMASGAWEGRHYIALGILLVLVVLCVVGGIGLIRKMKDKSFLPSADTTGTSQREYAEAAIRMQQVHGNKRSRKPVVLVLFGIIGVLIVALFILFNVFSH